jgi:hypothetical protein
MAMEKKARSFSWLLLAVLLGACTPDFDPQSLVNKFRIIAVKADPAAGLPGQEVHLRPLLGESKSGRPPILVWLTCIPYPGQTGTQCLEGGGATQVGFEETLTIRLPELAEGEDHKDIDAILLACAGVPRIPDFEKGRYDFCESPESDIAIRTVTVVRDNPNHNPFIESFAFMGGEGTTIGPGPEGRIIIDCAAECGDLALTLELAPGSLESYEEVRFGETITLSEGLFISWFATAGSYDDSRSYESDYADPDHPDRRREELTYDVKWTPPEEGGEVTFYFVAYDQRGGVDFRIQEALVHIAGT